MAMFCLKDSEEYYLKLSDPPKRFDADSPVTNVFFDDTNGQVFTVRSGGVTGVTVTGMDSSKSSSFRMEDKGPIVSIKFSPDHKVLAIQRNHENQSPIIQFLNFDNLSPTDVEYSQTCKWKNAKILGFVWPKLNEIAFVTDHGIELLQVLPEKRQLKSLKNVSFSGAWFSWCAQSNIVLLAGNNGALLQPFQLDNSTITKLHKLELDTSHPVVERDVFLLRLCEASWCAIFRHGIFTSAASPGPTEVWLMPVAGTAFHNTHVLKTGLVGRFAVSVVDDLIIVHHQSSQTSQVFDIMEESKVENGTVIHIPIVVGASMKTAVVGDAPCPMYSSNWVVFQPDYIIDARLGCLWQVHLVPSGLAHSVPKEEISKIMAVLLRRKDAEDTVYRILNQLVDEAPTYLLELTKVFDEINSVYRRWAELEMARNTAGQPPPVEPRPAAACRVLVGQHDMCARVLAAPRPHAPAVVTAYLASLSRLGVPAGAALHEAAARALAAGGGGGGGGRLRALAARRALGDSRALACLLLALGRPQLALDMMARLRRRQDVVEVLVGMEEPVAATGVCRQMGVPPPARKLLAAAQAKGPAALTATRHALQRLGACAASPPAPAKPLR